jgi:hypothetical protein
MSMKAMIKPEIWTDSDFHGLDPSGKLAFFWLITNWTRNNVGLSKTDKAQFEFDTGLDVCTLDNLASTLTSSLTMLKDRNTLLILALNFIKHNLPVTQLSLKAPIGRSVIAEANALPGVLRDALCSKYPNLAAILQSMATNPRLEQPPVQGSTGQDSAVQGSTVSSQKRGSADLPSEDDVIRFGEEWPGDMARMVPAMDPDWVLAWNARMSARSGDWPAQWQRAMISAWRSDWRGWASKKTANSNGGGRGDGTWGLKQRLEQLRQAAGRHPGNEQSTAYAVEAPRGVVDDYEKICGEIKSLEGQLTEEH